MFKKFLKNLRKPGRAKSIVAYVLFGAIVLVMALFFQTGPMTGGPGGGTAAIVNRTPISKKDYQIAIQRRMEMLNSRLQGIPDSQRQFYETMIKQRVLEELINQEVLGQSAKSMGFLASDDEVRDLILSIPQFKPEGTFRRDIYDSYLSGNRLTAGEFETKVRKELMSQKAQMTLARAMTVPDIEVKADLVLKESKMNIGFVEFDRNKIESLYKEDKKEIAAFISDEKNLPKLEENYNSNKEKYLEKEQVKAQHILIKAQEGDRAAEARAQEKIKEIQNKLKAGSSFDDLAKEYSEDEGSKNSGGSLGFFTKGRMVKEFEDVAFQLNPGEMSSPVKTSFGYHLIKVNEKKVELQKPLSDVKELVAKDILKKNYYDKFQSELKLAVEKSNLNSIDKLLKSFGIKWDETGEFSLNQPTIPKIGEQEKIVLAAISLKDKNSIFPNILELGGKSYLIQLKNIKKAELKDKELTMLKDEKQSLAMQRGADLFQTWLEKEKEMAKIEMGEITQGNF